MNVFKSLFKEAGVKDVITLFHAPKNQSSLRAYALLKQAAATSQAHATEDQASDHSKQSKMERTEFELDIQEGVPTPDQLNNILEYVGSSNVGNVVSGATSSSDALRKLKESENAFQRPVVVDWHNGRAVLGDSESEILKLVRELPKEEGKA